MKNEEKELEKRLEKMSPFEIKNRLIAFAEEESKKSSHLFLNAGRGNPNWINTVPREAFFLIGTFAISECRRTLDLEEIDLAGLPVKKGIASRFLEFLTPHVKTKAGIFLEDAFEYMMKLNVDADGIVMEWVEGVVGCQYPSPDRILHYTETIVERYLRQELCNNDDDCPPLELFATEGGTAAMCYVFNSLKANNLISEGDKIAIMTPIFTPYIEIPQLEEFKLDVVEINASQLNDEGLHTWQYPESELEKLKNSEIKLLCLVNPSNPPSYALSNQTLDKLCEIVSKHNPDLMIVSDDVYGTFVNGFQSLLHKLPFNTIGVYSFSKYFGCTGWRIAVIAVAKDNLFDRLIAEQGEEDRKKMCNRYQKIALYPDKIKFIDRLVADSRLVALNHTAGLSTPQQVQMSLFALYALLDVGNNYKLRLQEIIRKRLSELWTNTGFKLIPDTLCAGYYSEIDISVWARRLYGDEFGKYLEENFESIDFVVRLAKETGVVVLNGSGFEAPNWSIRVSLANLNDKDYATIGKHIGMILNEYAQTWKQQS